MMKLDIIEDKKVWEDFLLSQEYQPFFQSWNWGEVQERAGHTIYRLGLFDGKKLVGICLAVLVNAKRGRYLHLRHGPVLSHFQTLLPEFLTLLKGHAIARLLDFIRISPLIRVSLETDSENDEKKHINLQFFRDSGFRNAPIHNMDAENAWVLDLDKSEEELLSGMRKTTRYLVRKAQDLPLTITQSTDKKDFDAFMKLYEKTSRRHNFVPHRGIEEEFAIFAKENQAKLFLGRYKKQVLAGALIVFYGDWAVYHHGASSDEHKEIPAAYAVQWEAIKEAKRLGKKLYNFWGVVPPEKPKHPWQGLTLFKMGFGGRRLNFIHAQDLPLKVSYWKTYAIETVWRIRRGY